MCYIIFVINIDSTINYNFINVLFQILSFELFKRFIRLFLVKVNIDFCLKIEAQLHKSVYFNYRLNYSDLPRRKPVAW